MGLMCIAMRIGQSRAKWRRWAQRNYTQFIFEGSNWTFDMPWFWGMFRSVWRYIWKIFKKSGKPCTTVYFSVLETVRRALLRVGLDYMSCDIGIVSKGRFRIQNILPEGFIAYCQKFSIDEINVAFRNFYSNSLQTWGRLNLFRFWFRDFVL